ncbi:DUF4116 domain-containing protein [Neochlamydia sp. EPS4]|uniref:DUF4116 domain-containing protein n=1 Tax=Neochlamydia sp. EPS4 TaxID=1478175 RepID=UPI0005D111BE|nr:DUF4116 domain-containing protein [Neochlamydia sp. EPS4]
MGISNLSQACSRIDNIADYIPVISTVTNLVDLFQKCIISTFISKESLVKSHYYAHLSDKSFGRCITLLIPVLGNLTIAILDFLHRKSDNKKQQDKNLSSKHTTLQKDKEALFAIVKKEGLALKGARLELQKDKDIVLTAVKQNGEALQYASRELRDNKSIVLAAVEQNGWALEFASPRLQNDKDVVLTALRQNGGALRYASPRLKDDPKIVLAAIQENGWALTEASERLKKIKR